MRSAPGKRCDLGLEMRCASAIALLCILCLLRSLKALLPTALPTSGIQKSWPSTFCRCSARRRQSSSSRCLARYCARSCDSCTSPECSEVLICLVDASQANEQQRPLTLRTNTLKARGLLSFIDGIRLVSSLVPSLGHGMSPVGMLLAIVAGWLLRYECIDFVVRRSQSLLGVNQGMNLCVFLDKTQQQMSSPFTQKGAGSSDIFGLGVPYLSRMGRGRGRSLLVSRCIRALFFVP